MKRFVLVLAVFAALISLSSVASAHGRYGYRARAYRARPVYARAYRPVYRPSYVYRRSYVYRPSYVARPVYRSRYGYGYQPYLYRGYGYRPGISIRIGY